MALYSVKHNGQLVEKKNKLVIFISLSTMACAGHPGLQESNGKLIGISGCSIQACEEGGALL